MLAAFSSRALCGLLLSALLTATAAAENKPHDMSQMWQKSLTSRQPAATAAFDARGALWLAQVQDGHVLVSRSTDDGATFSDGVPVNAQAEAVSASGETRPKLAFGLHGEVYVAYTQSLETPFAGNVRFSRSLDGGQHFSEPVTVNDNLDAITHRFESMAVDRHGRIFLAWLDKRDAVAAKGRGEPFSGISVYSAMSDDAGASFHANRRVAEHSCECCRIAMAVDAGGTPVIVWRHVFGKNTRDHALARLTGHESTEAEPQRVTFDRWEVDACPHHGPSLAIAGQALHLAWFSNAPQHSGLFYAYSSNGGQGFTPPLPVGNLGHQPGHPSVLALGREVYLAWKEFDGEASTVVGMRSHDGGKHWDDMQKLAETRDQSDHPLLIARRDQAYLTWNTQQEGFRLLAWPQVFKHTTKTK
ncbi:MAG TPA: sialidase family protein [Gallionellaceae bacterium]|nr:sialidase family protein [Gallionellaceae bacterium]